MADGNHVTGRNRLEGALGVAIIVGAGLLMGLMELRHAQKMSTTLGVAVFALLPFVINLGLIAAGVMVWYKQYTGREILQIGAWVVLWMTAIGLLATWTITHQNIRGRSFAHAPFVTVNNMSVGGMIGFLIGWYDIHRRRYRSQVETEQARLEFLHSSLRHNVLNGLHIILGNVDILETEGVDSEPDRLETIRQRSEELARFSKATTALMENFRGHPNTSLRRIDLSATLDEELEKARAKYEDVAFHLDVPDDLSIEADDFLTELISNLLANAAIHNDNPTPEVTVRARPTEETVHLTVADNGPGIPDEEKDRMLEWNVKGTDSPGTGLGLPIADTIAERYGGRLWIEDNDPEGTVINVTMPLDT